MSPVFALSLRSIANRRLSVALTVVAVALAVALLLGVERLRNDARAGFAQTLSGTDLVVGARSGPVQLLLYSVFHLCLLYTSPSPRDRTRSRMPSSA